MAIDATSAPPISTRFTTFEPCSGGRRMIPSARIIGWMRYTTSVRLPRNRPAVATPRIRTAVPQSITAAATPRSESTGASDNSVLASATASASQPTAAAIARIPGADANRIRSGQSVAPATNHAR